MRKKTVYVLLLLALLLISGQGILAQAKVVYWNEWNVVIDNIDTAENRFDVREIYEVAFSGTFRFGSAFIPDNNLTSIANVQVYEAGNLLRQSCLSGAGTYCAERVQGGTSITYYFAQTITDASQNFEIRYTVHGALRSYEGGDQLWWAAIPSEHYGFSIGSSTVTVTLPPDFAPRDGIDPAVTYGAPTQIEVVGNKVVARTINSLGGNDYLEIRVQYPHDPRMAQPGWQEKFDERREFEEKVKPVLDLALIALGILLALGGPLAMFALWYAKGRDPQVGPVPEYLAEPPSDLPPAVVGTLVDEKADLQDVLSTVIDLGVRGYLVIEEKHKAKVLWFGGGSAFTFKRTDKPLDDLQQFEKRIIQKVFSSKLERDLEDLKYKFYQYVPKLQDDLYTELVKRKLVTSKPTTTRNLYVGVGGAILGLAVVLGILALSGMDAYTEALVCVPMALGVAGIAVMAMGQYMPTKTRKGAEEAVKWLAFKHYLENLEKYTSVDAAAKHFEAYLPYAIAFGLDRSWIRRMSRVPSVGIPPWYFPTYRGGAYGRGYRAGTPFPKQSLPSARDVLPGELARRGGGLNEMAGGLSNSMNSISDGLTNMLNSASRTFTSRPSSSGGGGGGFSGGGGGGGGFSGGGSRGFG